MPESRSSFRVLVAPSGFKECLPAEAVAAAIAKGVRAAGSRMEIEECPLADGGEGTAATMARVTGGTMHEATVCGPVGQPVKTHFAMLGTDGAGVEGTAIVDLASAAGLALVPEDRRDPLQTTSRGVGELIGHALDAGARRIIVGCGDSGVSDGGAGLAAALGVALLDADDRPIGPGGGALSTLRRIDGSGRDPRLDGVPIDVACNMKNVLTGEKGVARVFGPQKGASPDGVEHLDEALNTYARIVERDCGIDVRTMAGGGASGGAGAGLHALLGAELHSRFDLLFPYFDIDAAIERADIIVTAEGSVDFKSAAGKIPAELGARGRAAGKPVIVLAGTIGERADEILDRGVTAFFSILPRPLSLEAAMEHTERQLENISTQLMRLFLAGIEIGRGRG